MNKYTNNYMYNYTYVFYARHVQYKYTDNNGKFFLKNAIHSPGSCFTILAHFQKVNT
jgi:hypothetical protein